MKTVLCGWGEWYGMGEERSGVDGGSGLTWVKRGLVWMGGVV